MTRFSRPLAVTTLVLALIALAACRPPGGTRPQATPQVELATLARHERQGILSRQLVPDERRAPPTAYIGAVMERRVAGGGLATLIALEDGTIRLYLDTARTVDGDTTSASLRAVAATVRDQSMARLQDMRPTGRYPIPGNDSVTFYMLLQGRTLSSGPLRADVVLAPTHPFSRLARAFHVLLAQVQPQP